MSNFKKKIHNPIELISSFWPSAYHRHISYDPHFRRDERDYWIIRQSTHDGTLVFTNELLAKTLINLVRMESYHASREPDRGRLKMIKYKVGPIMHSTVFGRVKLSCSKTHTYPGLSERTRMAVKCDYIYKEGQFDE